MKLEEAMSYWRSGEERGASPTSEAELLERVKRDARAFDAHIQRRDRSETIVAAILFVIFAAMLPFASWLTRVGVLLVLAGCVSTFWRLRRARLRHAAASDATLADVLRTEHARIVDQIHLLDAVLWWYIAPFAAGALLVFAGTTRSLIATLIYGVVVVVFSIAVHRLNRSAVRKRLVPRRDRLAGLLTALEV